jgi:hypothetical protein
MHAALVQIGKQLGFQTSDRDSALLWEAPSLFGDQPPQWVFYCMASSIASRFVLPITPDHQQKSVLVLPGSRARLLSMKLRRDPRLAEAIRGWRILKFRHLREIAARPDMNAELWESMLDEDPLTEEATQMHLFAE